MTDVPTPRIDEGGALDAHLDRYGESLRRAATDASRVRRTAVRRRGVLGTIAAGGVACFAYALIGSPFGGGRVDAVAEARAVLDTPNQILHYSLSGSTDDGFRRETAAGSRCKGKPSEVWRTTSGPPRWRSLDPLAPCAIGISGEGRITTGATETSYSGRTLSSLAVDDGWMTVRTQTRPVDAVVPWDDLMRIPGTDRTADPLERIRTLMAHGRLREDGGRRDGDGRELLRLVDHHRASVIKGEPWRPVTVEYFVDRETFAPVVIRTTSLEAIGLGPGGRRIAATRFRRLTVSTRFHVFEHLPLNAETEHLLDVHPKPGTDVIRTTTPQWLRELARQRRTRAVLNPSPAESRRANAAIRRQQAQGLRPKGARW